MSIETNKKALPEYNIEKKYKLPKMLEIQEKELSLKKDDSCILQPKYDGAQAILMPTIDGGKVTYIPLTRKGNVIKRLVEQIKELNLQNEDNPVIFCEYEPVPWDDNNKAKLSANLYSDKELDFEERLIAFDQINNEDFFNGNMRNSKETLKNRLEDLDKYSNSLKNIEIARWEEMSYEDALEQSMGSRVELEDGSTRCEVLGVLCEGGVIRSGNKAQKKKPTIDKDISVLEAIKTNKGQIGWVAVDTKQPDKDGLMVVFGGVKSDFHKTLVDTVVEVEMLTVSGFKGAGNPTFTRSRENEKEFDSKTFKEEYKSEIKRFMTENKVKKDIDRDKEINIV